MTTDRDHASICGIRGGSTRALLFGLLSFLLACETVKLRKR